MRHGAVVSEDVALIAELEMSDLAVHLFTRGLAPFSAFVAPLPLVGLTFEGRNLDAICLVLVGPLYTLWY